MNKGKKGNNQDNTVTDLKNEIVNFKEIEERIKYMLENITDCIWEVDTKGKYTYVSSRVKDILGFKPSDLIGKYIYDFMPNDVATQVKKGIFEDNTEKRVPFTNYENIFISKDRDLVFVKTSGNPIIDDNGNWLGYRGSDHEITYQKKSEIELKAIFNNSADLICIFNNYGSTFSKVNPAFSKILGYGVNELVNTSFLDFIHPDDLKQTTDMIKNKLNKKVTVNNFEQRFRTKNGDYKFIEWTFQPGEINGDVYAIGRDITQQIDDKHTLKQYLDIFNNIQVGLHIYHLEDPKDKEGITLRLVSANKAAADFTGVSVQDIVGKTIDENFPGLRKKNIPKIYAKVAIESKPTNLNDFYYGDDRVIESAFSVQAFPLPGMRVGIAFKNITEELKAEKQLKGYKDHLEEMIQKRTKELEKNNKLLDDSLKVFVGREQTIIRLKKQIKNLELQLKSKSKNMN